MAVMNTFAKRLKFLREEHKLSQTELANALGISRGSLSFYENAERTADIETLYKVSEYFGVTLDYLIGKSDNRTKENAVIGEDIGLSDKSIKVLRDYMEQGYGNNFIKTLNYLIEQDELSPIELWEAPGLPPDIDEQTENKLIGKSLEKAEIENKEWSKTPRFPIIRLIEKYLCVVSQESEVYIWANGSIHNEKENNEKKWDKWLSVKALSQRNIIDNALLKDIEDQLRNSKRAIHYADDTETR